MRQIPQLTIHRKMEISLDDLLKDMKSFKEFRNSVESRLYRMEEATIANSSVHKASLLSDKGTKASSGFFVDLLREMIVLLENELKQKDTVRNFCKVVSKGIYANVSLVQSNDSEESSDDSKMIKNSCNGAKDQLIIKGILTQI